MDVASAEGRQILLSDHHSPQVSQPTDTITPSDSTPKLVVGGGGPLAVAHALRPWQWAKNFLLSLPLVLAHRVDDRPRLFATALAFACFCLCASAGYVMNDLRDRDADRRHPTKRRRPFASGALSPRAGMVMVLLLLGGAGAASIWLLPPVFTALLASYVMLSAAYSLWIKRRLLLDVFFLAGLYALRVVAGGAAAQVPITPWLLAFCIFFFLSLAFAKRYAELVRVKGESDSSLRGRAYRTEDLGIIESVGPTSGYMAVLVLALYISNSQEALKLYAAPWVLWTLCPVLLYWVTRLWFVARRAKLSEDPVVYALTDRVSLATVAVAGALMVAAWLGVPYVHGWTP